MVRSRPAPGGSRLGQLWLALPALGLSAAATTLATYLPILARNLTTSQTAIGALVGAEGFVSLLLPVWVGVASDRLRTPLGPRLPFMLVTAPIAALSIAALPVTRTIGAMALEVLVFYIAYFAYNAPYAALYSDLVPREHIGAAQGVQGVFRAAGTGIALVGGALLLQLGSSLPYAVSAVLLVGTTLASVPGVRRASPHGTESASEPSDGSAWSLVRDRGDVRELLMVNVLWQVSASGLKSFVVLYLTRGLHQSYAFCALAMAIVALSAVVGAPVAGALVDRYEPVNVMRILLAVYGVGLLVPVLWRAPRVLLAALPFVGLGGAMVLSLPYALLMRRLQGGSHGAAAGLFDVSNGAGTLLGPLVTGAAIDVLHPFFRATQGYGAMWPLLAVVTLGSIPLLRSHRTIGAN